MKARIPQVGAQVTILNGQVGFARRTRELATVTAASRTTFRTSDGRRWTAKGSEYGNADDMFGASVLMSWID